jgi:alpha-1,2-glucosyltransferase
MLYIWPFIAFFSVPVIIPVGIRFLQDSVKLLRLPLFPRLIWNYLFVAILICISLSATELIIKFNTIIHPFTLADNRHYMFYVFRYTILRHPLIRYLLGPIYLICAWLVYLTLCTPSTAAHLATFKDKKTFHSSKKAVAKEEPAQGPTTSFVIVLLASTALSLVGAPLVEPRYFIIPWVIWRLNVPALPSQLPAKTKTGKNPALLDIVKHWGWEGHDYRLWIETAWLLLINAVTGYIFLYRGFEWPQEPGNVQRFMW